MPRGPQDSSPRPKGFSEVLAAVKRIPRGKVSTYAEVAKAAFGSKKYARLVGLILRLHRDQSVPCHRVVRSDGSLGGFSRGLDEKAKLLGEEGLRVREKRVVEFEKRLHTF